MAKVKLVSYYVTFELFAEPGISMKEIKAEISLVLKDELPYKTKDLVIESDTAVDYA